LSVFPPNNPPIHSPPLHTNRVKKDFSFFVKSLG
jgi:hypothetical protein